MDRRIGPEEDVTQTDLGIFKDLKENVTLAILTILPAAVFTAIDLEILDP